MTTPHFLESFERTSKAGKLHTLTRLARELEASWPRRDLVGTLRGALSLLRGHGDVELRDLSRLADQIHSDMSRRHFLGIIVPIERLSGANVCDHHMMIEVGDRQEPRTSIIAVDVVCENIRSALNIGAFFRISDCFGLRSVHLVGYTATPDNAKVQRAALGCTNNIPWQQWERSSDAIASIREQEPATRIIGIETVADSPHLCEVNLQGPCALIFGNEVHGLNSETLNLCDEIARIPVFGTKNSLNVASAFAIAAYEARGRGRQSSQDIPAHQA